VHNAEEERFMEAGASEETSFDFIHVLLTFPFLLRIDSLLLLLAT
jgi:hypothetical protein